MTSLCAIFIGILLVFLLIQIGIIELQCYNAMSPGNPAIDNAY